MKKAFFAAAFGIAIIGSFAFKPSKTDNLLSTHYHIVGTLCQSFNDTECNLDNTHTVCAAVYQSQKSGTECQGATYRLNP